MAHYAFINSDNQVVEVITGRDETEVVDGISDWEAYYATKRPGLTCLRTSYNTYAGQHTGGGTPFRGNYAGKGYSYDSELDAFIPPKPYAPWTLSETTYNWEAPVAYPEGEGVYDWNEDSQAWVERV